MLLIVVCISEKSFCQAPPKSPIKNQPYVCKIGDKWLTQKQFDKMFPCTKCIWVVNGKQVSWKEYCDAENKLLVEGAKIANHILDSTYYGGKLHL